MSTEGSLQHLLQPSDLEFSTMQGVLDLAAEIKDGSSRITGALRERTLVAIFELPSTRTRIAIANAAHRLGMGTVFVGSGELQLARNESLADTARTLSELGSAIVLRTASHDLLVEFAAMAGAPVINALSRKQHPCEALVSMFTLREHFGRLEGLKLAFVGAGNNVAHSLMETASATGMDIRLACPPGHGPDGALVEHARQVTAATGGSVRILEDPRQAATGVDVVYSDAWTSMGDDATSIRAFAGFRVDADLMRLASPDAVFLHCLPAQRGQEVTADVIDGPRSLIWRHVANQVPVLQAILYTLISEADR